MILRLLKKKLENTFYSPTLTNKLGNIIVKMCVVDRVRLTNNSVEPVFEEFFLLRRERFDHKSSDLQMTHDSRFTADKGQLLKIVAFDGPFVGQN